jgi:hypothetical protein
MTASAAAQKQEAYARSSSGTDLFNNLDGSTTTVRGATPFSLGYPDKQNKIIPFKNFGLNGNSNNHLVFRNLSSGTFIEKQVNVDDVGGVGDVDGDNKLEIVYKDDGNKNLHVYNVGTGNTQGKGVNLDRAPSSVVDVDGDGDKDVPFGDTTMKYYDFGSGSVKDTGVGIGTNNVYGSADADGDGRIESLFFDGSVICKFEFQTNTKTCSTKSSDRGNKADFDENRNRIMYVDASNNLQFMDLDFSNDVDTGFNPQFGGISGLVTDVNSPPQFSSTSVSPDPPLIGQTADFSYSASDPDGSISSVDLTLKDDGTTVFTGSKSSTSGTFNPPDQLTQGDVTAEFTTTDNKGATVTTTLTRTLTDNPPSVQVVEPTDLKNTKNPAFNVSVDSTGDSEPNEQVTVKLFKDGAQFDTRTITGKGFVSGSASFDSEGTHTFKALASENAGSNQDTSTFTVDTTPPGIQILQPDGKTNDTQGIPLKFQAKDAVTSVDTTTFEYAKDGGTRISTSGNTTIDYGTTGQHNVTVFAQDQAGNEGQTTKSFTADIKNTLTADTAVANTQIDTFTATFENSTDTLTEDTTNGQIEFFTTELPKGDVTVTVNSPGFTPSNQTLSGVDSTFNQDLNLDLERAGFTFNAFNEQKPSEELDPRTVTISNGTASQQLNTTEVNIDYGFGPFKIIDEGDSATLLDEAKDRTPLKADKLRIEETYGGGSGIMNIEVFVNGDSKGFIDDVGTGRTHTVDIQPTRITKIRIEAFNTNDGDGSNEDAEIEIQDITALPPDTGKTTLDFEAFKKSDLPTRDVDVKVEAPGFQTRTYQAQIDGSTKTTLDAFLLPQNQGIQPSIEVRDGQQNRLEDAQATVLRTLGSKGTKTVAQAETATDGTAAFFLDPDVTYTLLVKKQQFGTFRGSFNPTSYEFEPLRIRLKTSSNFTESTVWDKVDFRLQPEQGTVNRTGRTEFNFSVSDPENELTQAGIKIFVDGQKVNETTVTGSSTGLSTALSQNITGLNVSQGDNLRCGASSSKTRN